MKQTDLIKTIFARHETFHPRYGWLKKGYDKVLDDPGIFRRDNAPVILGVGKNMVNAIKFWCLAFKIIEETKSKGQKITFSPSVFGNRLFSDEGSRLIINDREMSNSMTHEYRRQREDVGVR